MRLAAAGALLAILSGLAPAPPAVAASTQDRLAETRRELRAARSRLATLVRSDRDLLAVIGRMSRQLGRTRSSLQTKRLELSRLRLGIQAHARRLEALAARQRSRQDSIANRVRSLYILGPGYQMESLLTARSYDEFLARTSTLEYVVRADRTIIQDLDRLRDRVGKARAELFRRRAAADRVRDAIAEREDVQEELLGVKLSAEAQLSKKMRAELAEVRALQAEQSRIIAIIQSRQSISTGPISRRGFAWPIRGRVTSPYGYRHGEFHTGIDIDCRTGNPIGASKAGRVIAAEWGGGYGRMVIVDHGNGVSTLYAHMSRLYVREGSWVAQRKVVGACGETGRAYGDHLHFEVRVNGHHRNPRTFLP